ITRLCVPNRARAVSPQAIPDEPAGPRYVCSSGGIGRIVIARKNDGPNVGKWLFTAESVERIEPMFLAVMGKPVDESLRGATAVVRQPMAWDAPGIWLRLRISDWARVSAGSLELYQWTGLALTL